MKPRLLDLFCGAGGAAMGYHLAGFDVVGVDINPQKNFPFEFIQADAIEFLAEYISVRGGMYDQYDAIHASPPCQAYSHGAVRFRNEGKVYPDLLAPTRELLNQTGLPWVIENVPGAPMRADIKICGCQVGLRNLRRDRWFETSWHCFALTNPHDHSDIGPVVSVTGHGTPTWVRTQFRELEGRNPNIQDYRDAMGIDWMNRGELSQAIPPAYTQFVGEHLMAHIQRVAA